MKLEKQNILFYGKMCAYKLSALDGKYKKNYLSYFILPALLPSLPPLIFHLFLQTGYRTIIRYGLFLPKVPFI